MTKELGGYMRFEFDVDLVLNHARERTIVGTIAGTHPKSWKITPESTINGAPIQCLTLPPRALNPDGTPKRDIVAFQLTSRSYLKGFSRGQRV